jgi:tRNA (mo5U34)-methyltransferase
VSTTEWTPERIRTRAEALGPWFHNLDLNGVRTAPEHFLGDYPQVKWQRFKDCLPADLSGRTVLDIGCNAGFYSMEMKRRGAARVLGVDFDEDYLAQARFAAEVEGLDIEFRQLSVYDVGALGERFDIVFFIGVLYHLRHPLLALDLVREHAVKDLMLFESMCRGSTRSRRYADDYPFEERDVFDEPAFPKMHFIENRYADDGTNWWAPNVSGMEAMLRSSGFELLQHPIPEVWLCRAAGDPAGEGAVYPARRGGG